MRYPPFKRVFDLAVVLFALVPLILVIAILALLIRLKLGTPIFFRQPRPGLYGRPFTLLKFRTMTEERDVMGGLLPDAERLTRFGYWLRASSLDELPTLFNVLKGEMSLAGPRPLLMHYLDLYTPEQMRRHDVTPGLTGWAQINGRNAISWEEKFAYDLWYVAHQSLWLDLKIILTTVRKVVQRKGISQPGAATMPQFTGTTLQTGVTQSAQGPVG